MEHVVQGRWRRLRRRWVVSCGCGWQASAGRDADPQAIAFHHMLHPEEGDRS